MVYYGVMHHLIAHKRITIAAVATCAAILLIALGAVSYIRGDVAVEDATHPVAQPRSTASLIAHLLGLDQERTFLVLLLNNTEIRPAGGFIGTYALVQMKNAKITNFTMQGSEILDYAAPIRQETYPPPKPMQEYLQVKQWQFRDSNWSPDFAESSKWGMWLYRFERGELADKIDGVIGVTTDVLDELVKKTGPVTADGVTLHPGTAVADLEYEVEYGFNERNIAVLDRKEIMKDIGEELFRKIMSLGPRGWVNLAGLAKQLAREKHLIMYSVHPEIQKTLHDRGWDGAMPSFAETDGFMVVDANLGAWKTDHAMARNWHYTVRPEGATLRGVLRIQYKHTGVFDWRTVRYRSYTRVYLPRDAVIESVSGFTNPEIPGSTEPPDYGARPGMQVLGGYIRVAPGETHELEIVYKLPPRITRDIKEGSYTLLVPKQIGLVEPQLTVDLDFGKTIQQAGGVSYAETRAVREDYARTLNFD